MSVVKTLANIYLDYRNDFLTYKGFAEYYGVTESQAERLIQLGKEFHESLVTQYQNGESSPKSQAEH